jgi:hypothetical protein
MKTLGNERDKTDLLARLQQLQPDSHRRWGKMSAHQMVCHLTDSFKTAVGERQVSSGRSNSLTRTFVRWIALYAPIKWPHGVPTMPENDQERGGTPPEGFQGDVGALVSIIERLCSPNKDFQWWRHPLFGEMSERDWLRWGYLHVDHHLRQFGL